MPRGPSSIQSPPSPMKLTLLEFCRCMERVKQKKNNNDKDEKKKKKKIVYFDELDWSGCHMGHDGVTMLSRAFSSHAVKVRKLRLGYNLISSSLASNVLIPSMGNLLMLEELDLRGNSIGDDGAQAIANQLLSWTCKRLLLRNNNIGPVGARALLQATAKTHLERLDLSTNPIGKNNHDFLSSSSLSIGVKELVLCNANLGPRDVQHLCSTRLLCVLDLSGNRVGNEGAVALAQNPTCCSQEWHLSHCHIGAAGAKELARVTRLRLLDLLHNPIGMEGVAAFCHALRHHNRTLQKLLIDQQQQQQDDDDDEETRETRTSLESLYRRCCCEIRIYLVLNQHGRNNMLSNTNNFDWALWSLLLGKMNHGRVHHAADLLYLTLLEKPELLKRAPQTC